MRILLYTAIAVASAACSGPAVVVTRPAIAVDSAVRLAADVILPANRPTGGVPTVLIQTRYWRSFRMRGGGGPKIPQGPRDGVVARLVAAGFAVVVTDVRGTGASDGIWRWPWSADEVRDMGPVIDWIVAQSWSNGAVGATGVSYEGTTALLTAAAGRPALKAVLARQLEWQLVDETIAPDGVRNALFADTWGAAVDALDHGRYPKMFPRIGRLLISGVARRDDDPKGDAQKAREAARASSDIAARTRSVYAGTDAFGPGAPAADSLGPAGHAAALARTGAVVAIWGSWWDGGTADAVFRAQQVMPIAEAVIGPWTHEGDHNASPLRSGASERPTVDLDSVVAFFSRHLRPDSTRTHTAPRVRWYVAGTERWRDADRWPETTMRTWNVLASAEPGSDSMVTWRTTADASTGVNNRWTTGLARPVDVSDRARATGIQSFLIPPFAQPLSVFGAGAFRCTMRADQPDATLHVYVESVDTKGRVRLLTEGMRRVQSATDLQQLTFRLRPVAFALPTGWGLRVSFASEDRPTFERVPAADRVSWTAQARDCSVSLPVESANHR